VMAAIENCRTAALGGHVARCENDKCGYTLIAYNSCRNRHCPKCQGAAAREWLAAREAELLPVPYFHVVFSLPAQIADIAYHNKAAIYDILFKASAETMITIAHCGRAIEACRPVARSRHQEAARVARHTALQGEDMADSGPCKRLGFTGEGIETLRAEKRHRGLSAAHSGAVRSKRLRGPRSLTVRFHDPHPPITQPKI
jgi:hypothetical protein